MKANTRIFSMKIHKLGTWAYLLSVLGDAKANAKNFLEQFSGF